MSSHGGRSRRVFRWNVAALGGAIACVAFAGTGWGQQPLPTLAEVEAKWRVRQDKTPSFRISWETKRTLPKGSLDIVIQLSGEPGKTGPAPRIDTVVDEKGTILISGKRFRLDIDTTTWSVKEDALQRSPVTHASDGVSYTHYIRKSEAFDHGTAHQKKLDAKGAATILQPLVFMPVVLTFRGTDTYFAMRPIGEFRITRWVPHDGRNCIELVRENRTQNRTEILILDPQRDFVLLRAVTLSGNTVQSQVDVTYAPSPDVGWVPLSWESVLRSPTAIVESCRIQKATVEILHDPVSDEEFRPSAEPGTRVIDRTGDAPKHSVVRSDGSPGRSVTVEAGKRTPRYEELVARNEEVRSNWYVWVAVLAIIILVGFFGCRYWLQRSKPMASIP